MNWTAQCGRFEKFSLGMIPWKRNRDFRFECHNFTWRIGTHFLRRFNRHSFEPDRVPLGGDPHNRRHASSERRRH